MTEPIVSIAAYLSSRLAEPLPGAPAQRRLAPRPAFKGWAPDQAPEGARRAAALILLYPHTAPGGVALPLTVRHAALPLHPGQISLPGGAVDPGEPAELAAVRETYEELGVPSEAIRVLGALSPLWVVVSNFVVQTFVGVAETRPEFHPAPDEVEAVLEVPLTALMDAGRLRWAQRVRDGVAVRFPYFDIDGREVWGATAMMLGEFCSLFDPAFGAALE